ncbi:uncharacterized protein F4822DRAFT_445660 [Hypoxylon trugodes]|uniref:uncharacterized protein n=1 Tax=Hypoxylon trugodes TaxID=326681 RepID=UPI0021923A24|nr:uncharacterized protein F4822DRAFT_445660 [Hypoxylon trugodes]KAI1385756.1 hypothetical protein F4822DRAFT_445660 [Hypoxylon trugodes]
MDFPSFPPDHICYRPTRRDTPIAVDIHLIDVTLTAANRHRLSSNIRRRTAENMKMNTGSSHLKCTIYLHGWLCLELVLLARRAGPPKLEHDNEDDLVSVWLSGVSCPDCLQDGADLTDQNTPLEPINPGDKVENVLNFACPTIVVQPPRRNRSTAQSGTGLDGPQSSESDKLSKLLRDGLSDLKESSQSADPSTDSHNLNSNTSGSIDWDRDWEKRKPRQKHEVSEVSNSNHAYRTHVNDPIEMARDNGNVENGSGSEDTSDNKSCSYLSQHDARFHAIQRYALNSCPELHRQLDDFDRSLFESKVIENQNQDQITQLRSQLEKNRHWHHFHIRNIVTRQFRSLGKKLRRSGSSTFTIRSDLPARRGSKERRLLARESVNNWPSSGEETPLFNTPESNAAGLPHNIRHHFDPLAMASMMIATGELDRLSSRPSFEKASKTSGSSTGFSGSSPTSHTPYYSGAMSPNEEMSLSELAVLEMPLTIPFNTPSSSNPQSGVVSPVSRPSQRRGQRRRGQRSRLSEVTTPDEIKSPAEPAEGFIEGTASISSTQIETLLECSHTPVGADAGLCPKPLTISRSNTGPHEYGLADGTREIQWTSRSSTPSPHRIILLDRSGSPILQSSPSWSTDESISPPARVSSIGKTPESMYTRLIPFTDSPVKFFELRTPAFPVDTCDSDVPCSTAETQNEIITPEGEVIWTRDRDNIIEDADPDSCHPDTWSESQGEPGNSDPFCPPDCLESRHSSHS